MGIWIGVVVAKETATGDVGENPINMHDASDSLHDSGGA